MSLAILGTCSHISMPGSLVLIGSNTPSIHDGASIFGAKFSADADPFEQYSPIHRIHPEAPPMMMIHGTRDALIPIEAARPFAAKLARESHHAVAWVEVVGAQHAFDLFPSPRTVRTIEYVERFLDGVHRGIIK